MAADVAVSMDTLTCSLKLLVNLGKVLLLKAKQDAEESLENFVPNKITTLFGLMTAGTDFYKSLGVKKKSEAEAIWQKYYHHTEVRELVEELQLLESEWDSFLEEVDRDLQMTDGQLSGGQTADSLSPDTTYTDARSGKSVSLDHLTELEASQAALAARSVRVLVVSYGGEEGAQLWLEQTGCSFNMVLDPHRKTYRSFGLGSSYAKVMRFGCLLQYSEYGAVDKEFPDVPSRLLEDMYQMGGNFLLDEAGLVLFSHPCKNPHDRPSAEDILEAAEPQTLIEGFKRLTHNN